MPRGPPYAQRELHLQIRCRLLMNQIQTITDDEDQVQLNQQSHADTSLTAPQSPFPTGSQDHLRSISRACHPFHTPHPLLLISGLVQRTMIHFVQRGCIKLRKELGGISSGCRRILIPRDRVIHLLDTLLNLMLRCHLINPVPLSLICPATRIDLVYFLFPRGGVSPQSILSGVGSIS
jgi:hypothetical protein